MWYRDTKWENAVGRTKTKNGANRFSGYRDAKKPLICGGKKFAKHNKTRYACSKRIHFLPGYLLSENQQVRKHGDLMVYKHPYPHHPSELVLLIITPSSVGYTVKKSFSLTASVRSLYLQWLGTREYSGCILLGERLLNFTIFFYLRPPPDLKCSLRLSDGSNG